MADGTLTFDEVEGLVRDLHDRTLQQLAEGPLPEPECRACIVRGRAHGPQARGLKRWHEFFDQTPNLDAVTKAWRSLESEDARHQMRAALAEWKKVAGALSYARCSTIYALARVELHRREPSRG